MQGRAGAARPAVGLLAVLTGAATIAAGLDRTPAGAHDGARVRAVSFAAARNFLAGDGPIALGVGDFNHDGRKDLAVANLFGNDVSVLVGAVTGFEAPTSFPVGVEAHSVALVDLNDDRHKDLVVANAGANTVSVLLGAGTGGFSPATDFATGNRPAWAAVGDFNDDDEEDLAVTDFNANTVSVLLGAGTGSFHPAASFPAGTAPRSAVVGDFDNDGNQDLAVTNQAMGPIAADLTAPFARQGDSARRDVDRDRNGRPADARRARDLAVAHALKAVHASGVDDMSPTSEPSA